MSSTPLIACSSGDATVSAMTCGFAPGYMARTTTVGGTTSGYSLIGSTRSDSAPAMKMIADKTPAKIGRWMKNWEKFMLVASESGVAAVGVARVEVRDRRQVVAHGDAGLPDRHAGAYAL